MEQARIASLLAPFLHPGSLTDRQLAQVAAYLDLLLKWNARINLTSVRQPDEIVTRHFGESFFTARQLRLADSGGSSLIDLGSGAGFPGLPLKIYAPQLSVTLIESSGKKATFLRESIRALTLINVDVFAGRAENFPRSAEIVTLRAVEQPERALAVAARLVSPGGRLALLVGAALAEAIPGLLLGFSWDSPISIPGSSGRILLLGSDSRVESN